MSTTVPESVRRPEQQSSSEIAVAVDHVQKTFKLPHRQYHTLKERMLHPFATQTFDLLHSVDDVSVHVGVGEFFGIIGRNGSGKSTLLKCIAGIYRADGGDISVRGRLSPFIELGVGFNMDLTARDNVMINAIMLGLTRKEARARFDQIIEFAELHNFLDMKLKNYSSGMLVRLAFSVAIQVEAEILLIDEVLAVGDANFQQKCFDEFERLKRDGRTILFVTHDMSAIERFCDRAMLLDHGKMIGMGDPAKIARDYNKLNFGQTVHELSEDQTAEDVAATGAVAILDGWFENGAGTRIAELAHGEPVSAVMEIELREDLENPLFGATIRNDVGATVFSTTTDISHGDTGRFKAGDHLTVRLRFDNWLAPSRYSLTPSVARHGLGSDVLALREDIAHLQVHGGQFTGSVVILPHTFEIGKP